MQDLTGFQRDLLYVVNRLEEPSGIDVKEELETYYDDPINHGRLYPNLDTLVEKGLIRKRRKNRRTNRYGLTARGRREVRARRKWEDQYVSLEIESEDGDEDGDGDGGGGGDGGEDGESGGSPEATA